MNEKGTNVHIDDGRFAAAKWRLSQVVPVKFRGHFRDAGMIYVTEWWQWRGSAYRINDRSIEDCV